ncbi:acyl-coenzyme A thioesterase 6-like [Pomacea canaliculata]|uniref:acyl-coenzyme A thioesterase 6-like n=1 Tax=Pomacea canaliculata TaxID=400727 RepID=UPI000D73EC7B|nr:acyl-coenzyme A thioesterase 6-like [Pomacea canaliculata]
MSNRHCRHTIGSTLTKLGVHISRLSCVCTVYDNGYQQIHIYKGMLVIRSNVLSTKDCNGQILKLNQERREKIMNTTSCRLLNIGKILSSYPAQQCVNGSSSHNLCTLSVSPSVSIFDQKVSIRIHGLPSHGMATLQAWMHFKWRGKDILFVSYGRYYADSNGEIDLDRHPSLSGTYTGVDSMGLFWSMGSLPGHPKDVCMAVPNVQVPILINLALFSGHITVDESSIAMKTITPLCTCTITRLCKAPDVKRIEIKEGNIRGALLLPPGNGPFPGVIDMYGGAGGLRDARAGLLATRGFATLALAYFKYQDLPEDITDIRLEYFQLPDG